MASAESHLELSAKYLNEGKSLIDKNPVQASEKLIKLLKKLLKHSQYTST
jgi:hypothetical protein